jgi:hypothetical protein
MARSRINRQLQEKSMHTIILSILGSIAIILLLIFFGVPAIIKLGSALSHSDTNIEAQTDATTFIAPPSIDPLFSATNSATITVSGSSTGSYTIRLYNNDTFLEEMSSKDNGTFQFRNVHLKDGDNALKVIAKDTKKNKTEEKKETEETHGEKEKIKGEHAHEKEAKVTHEKIAEETEIPVGRKGSDETKMTDVEKKGEDK